ncbi:HAD-IIA family hydrolase [Pectinatus frisingensis]|uniref:HAD-IIA family hydrolase n=1 Tax=Pectinatus frisingensis TaxID=865 RepID=UPI0018C7A950|nr:HAD-IIA family hydrolase [Pectinatus frisingensis]
MFSNTNEDKNDIIKNIEYFALDMDGTVYLDDYWIEGAKDFLKKIESSKRKYVFLTNNSSKGPKNYVDKLHKMGLDIDLDKIITSGQATIYYLQQHYPGKKVFLLGNDLLKEDFAENGILLDDTNPDLVVTAFDTTLDYNKMSKVCDFVRAGLPYIATHPDYNCPTKTGFIPDAGAIHAFIKASSFRYPDRIIGKPNVDIVKYLLARLNTTGKKVLMVGDRLYTDIATGVNNGLYSMLVLSGETKLKDVESSKVKPHLIFDSVKEVIPFL